MQTLPSPRVSEPVAKARTQYRFRLYVAAEAQNSVQALANLNALCRKHLAGRFEIQVVDVYRHPRRALDDNILMTPTLLKLEPFPQRRVIGSLSQTDAVLQALGLESAVE